MLKSVLCPVLTTITIMENSSLHTTMSSSLPFITIQCDWNEAVRVPNSEVWISSKYLNNISEQGKIKTTPNKANGKIIVDLPEEYNYISHGTLNLVVRHISSGLKVAFIAPTKAHDIHKKAVLSVSTAENGLALSSDEDDKLLLWDSRTNEVLLDLKGHRGPVYKCKIFPSNIVLISGGADGSSRIWSAQSGINPVTLIGHKMSISDICIVQRGRNVITVSKDGTAKLWDCGESRCIENIISGYGPITCCSLTTTTDHMVVSGEREVGTGNKLLVVGCRNGTIICAHVGKREILWRSQLESPCNDCVIVEDTVVIGCSDGKLIYIKLVDGSTLKELHESASPILCLAELTNQMYVVGRQDGTCTILSLRETFENVRVQLTGSDCDGIRDISFNGKWIFAACRDTFIRKYDFNQISLHYTYNVPSSAS